MCLIRSPLPPLTPPIITPPWRLTLCPVLSCLALPCLALPFVRFCPFLRYPVMPRPVENAEGLLVLADALVEASSESPDLIIDCATLTGIWTLSAGRGRKRGAGREVGGLWSVIGGGGGGGVRGQRQGLTKQRGRRRRIS